jgi:hypothetical protein
MGNSSDINYAYPVASGPKPEGETRAYRHVSLQPDEDLCSIMYEGVDNLKKSFKRTCRINADKNGNFLGTRKLMKEEMGTNERTGKPEHILTFGEYQW